MDHAFARIDKDRDDFISLDELLDQMPPTLGGVGAEQERREVRIGP